MKKNFVEDNDTLARKIDQFVRSCNKQLQNIPIAGADEELKGRMLGVAREHLNQLAKQHTQMERMNEKDEVKRLENIKIPLMTVIDRLSPNEDEADYFRAVQNDDVLTDDEEHNSRMEDGDEEDEGEDDDYEDGEEDDDDEEEEEDSEEYTEDDETEDITEDITSSTVKSIECEAIETFDSQETGDMSFRKGEKFLVKSQRRDGWWEAENVESGKSGLVPSNFMRVISLERTASTTLNRKPKPLKDALRDTKFENLRASQSCHTGSRPSSLIKLLQENTNYHLSTWLHPRLSATCISFKDLHWDMRRNNIVPVDSINRIVTLNMIRNMPPPKSNASVISRRVHIAVTTKSAPTKRPLLSNIHTVTCTWTPTDPNNWKFVRNNGSLYHPKIICRLESADANLGLLIEVCAVHKNDTNERVEVCAGWTFMPLFQTNGAPVPNKTQGLRLYGGAPFEAGVDIDDNWPVRRTFGKPGKPQINIGISSVSRFKQRVVALLPSTILTSTLNIKTISLFRQALGQTILKENEQCQNGVIFNPTLSLMLQAVDQPVLLDMFKRVHMERSKNLKRADKNDPKFMRKHLETVLKDIIWPMVVGTTTQLSHDPLTKDEISERIALGNAVATQGALSLFVKEGPHTPFNVSELCYVPIYRENFVSF